MSCSATTPSRGGGRCGSTTGSFSSRACATGACHAQLHGKLAAQGARGAPPAACCGSVIVPDVWHAVIARRLIGSVGFVLADGSPALVTICAGPRLELVYELVVNGERVPHGDPAKGTMWSFTLRDGPDAGPGGKAESGSSGAAAASGARAGPDGAAPGEMETAPPLTSCDTAGCRVEVEFGEDGRRGRGRVASCRLALLPALRCGLRSTACPPHALSRSRRPLHV